MSPGGGPPVRGFAPEDESRGSGRVDAGHSPALQCDSPQHLVVRDRAQAGRGYVGRWLAPSGPDALADTTGRRVAVYGTSEEVAAFRPD
jgi:hypothetical protein